MTHHLAIHVRLHDDRYHGTGGWPPSPARLFQALVAGVGLSGTISDADRRAFEWLESLDPPLVAAPHTRDGQSVAMFVPGNDLDKVGGDPRRIGEVRDEKLLRPRVFDRLQPFLYVWPFDTAGGGDEQAARVCALADRLYQFGRGIDVAWAWGEKLDDDALDDLLTAYPGIVCRPSAAGAGETLTCPQPGSFDSLEARHHAPRFAAQRRGRTSRRVFSQSPPPRFASIPYNSPSARVLYDLRDLSQRSANPPLASWPQTGAAALVTQLRDLTANRLHRLLPQQTVEIDRVLIGRKPNGANSGPTSARVRIIPLPSVGHEHADQEIRRVLIEVPAECPLRSEDVHWAFSGLNLVDPGTGELLDVVLARTQSPSGEKMLAHYGVGAGARRLWRTVTPAVLPYFPGMHRGHAVGAAKRIGKSTDAARAAAQALRHTGVRQRPISIAVQREPFEVSGQRAAEFAAGTRFESDRLWHVEICLPEGVTGPVMIGDGRFLGLGLMAPVQVGNVDADITYGLRQYVA